jgi:hypothetical protein
MMDLEKEKQLILLLPELKWNNIFFVVVLLIHAVHFTLEAVQNVGGVTPNRMIFRVTKAVDKCKVYLHKKEVGKYRMFFKLGSVELNIVGTQTVL